MIVIIHGDDTVASRKKLEEYSKNTDITFDHKSSVDDIIDAVSSQSLFDAKKTVIVEQFAPLAKDKSFLAFLQTVEKKPDISLIFWEDEKAPITFLKKFPSSTNFLFELPKLFFAFLDGAYPGNGVQESKLLKKMPPNFSDVQIFYALVKRVRLLLMLKSDGKKFDELLKMSPWQERKLVEQARRWKSSQLISFYSQLFEVEKSLKTSSLPLSLINHIDILLINALQ